MNEAMTQAEREFEAELDGSLAAQEAVNEVKLRAARDIRSAELGSLLIGEFQQAVQDRNLTELRLIEDLRQFKGLYTTEQLEAMEGASKYYSRKTRAKVTAVTAKQNDLMFPSSGARNYSVAATPIPTIADEVKANILQGLTDAMGQPPDKATLDKAVKKFADEAAEKMSLRIDDQLAECQYRKVARQVMLSGNLYGTGILKGPLVQRRSRVTYQHKAGKWLAKEKHYVSPFVESTSIWAFYPDMAASDLKDCRYVYERHLLTRAAMEDLARRKSFKRDVLRTYIDGNPDGITSASQPHEAELEDMGNRQSAAASNGKYELIERWGWLTREQLIGAGVNCGNRAIWFANVWLTVDGQIVKAVMAPMDAVQWPYHLYYFDKDETSIFGDGLAALMREDQDKINAAERALLDNAAITAGAMYEVFVKHLDPGDDPTNLHARKVFLRTSGDEQYPVVRPIITPSHTKELAEIAGIFDSQADENSGIPKFSYGAENPTNGALGTATGYSMAMGQANIAMRTFVVNYDDVTSSFIGALYHWNMKYSDDDEIKGDYNVKAEGANSLIAKEIKANMLAQYVATLQPEERQYVKFHALATQRANAMELSDVIMTEKEFEQQMQNPQFKQQQEMADMQQKLGMAQMEKTVAKLEAEVAKISAEANRIAAGAMKDRTEAAFAAMQAGGAATQSPHAAAAGDKILGWAAEPAAPQSPANDLPPPVAPAPGAEPPVGLPETAGVGEQAGIETAALEPA